MTLYEEGLIVKVVYVCPNSPPYFMCALIHHLSVCVPHFTTLVYVCPNSPP
jgi:hypothetical protein